MIELAEKCKIIFDQDDFLKNKLEEIKEKIKKYRTNNIPFKGKYCWEIKEDYKWGVKAKL